MRALCSPTSYLLAVIAAVGLALRAASPGLAAFGYDEGLLATYATLVSHAGSWPAVGLQTSFGFHNPPAAIYLLAPLFAITTDPRVATLLLAVLGTLAIPMVFRTGKLLGGPACGLIAAALVAVSPNAVEHSRRLWGHDTVVLFSALATWLALEADRGRAGGERRWLLLGGSFAAAALGQTLHLSAAIAWLPGLVVLARKRAWKALPLGGGVLLLLYAPWLWRELTQGWPDLRALAAVLGEGRPRDDLGLAVPPLAAWAAVLADSWNHDLIGPERPWMISRWAAAGSFLASACGMILLGLGLLRLARGWRHPAERTAALALALPLLATPVLFGIVLRASVPPYQLPALVPAALAAGWALGRGGERWRIVAGVFVAGALVLLAAVRSELATGTRASPVLGAKMEIVRLIRESAGEEGRLALYQNARDPAAGVDYWLDFLMHHQGLSHRVTNEPVGGRPGFVVVDRPDMLAPEAWVFLRQRAVLHTHWGRLDLYVLRGEALGDWDRLIRRGGGPAGELVLEILHQRGTMSLPLPPTKERT